MEDIIISAELDRRPSRPPEYEAESRALTGLMRALADSGLNDMGASLPGSSCILQEVAERALELCRAQSAGVSLIDRENGSTVFRWQAVAGRWAKYRGHTMPRQVSPCGTMLDRNRALLIKHPERCYPLAGIEPTAAEALLIPVYCAGAAVGAMWVLSHDEERKFDAEDLRLLTSLGRFAATAYQLLTDREAKATLAAQLEAELAGAQWLQEISLELIREDDVETLYAKILDAAVAIMRSDLASIQMLESRGGVSNLRLLGHRGFNAEAAEFWSVVPADSESACAAALRTGQRVVLPDVQADPESAASCDTLEKYRLTGIRAVQTTPLLSRSGRLLGMISTHWGRPHRPSERDLRLLDVLARQAADLIERSRTAAALRESEQRFRTMADTAPAILCATEPDGACSFLSRGWYEFTGQAEEEGRGFGWLDAIHPDDRAATQQEFLAANERAEAFAREHRVRHANGEYRWMICAGRPRRTADGAFGGYVVSIIDITDRKQAEDRTKLLLREVNHRSKNLLAVVQAVARQTAGDEDPKKFAERFTQRLAGIAASQDLLVQNDWRGVDVDELVRSQLAHFVGLIDSRIVLEGPEIRVSPAAAQTIGMALHELATNAGKYGALSDKDGHVTVTWRTADDGRSPRFQMRWLERNGPPVYPPERLGFGHTVMVRMVEYGLDADVLLKHDRRGLHWEICAPLRSVIHPTG